MRRLGAKLKPPVFAAIAAALVFGLVELALWCARVPTLLSERDPFLGFSERVPVFELHAGRGLYVTPPRATEHSFNYQEFRAAKPANGFRVFVLGGSSAFGFPWGARVAFPRALGDALRAAWPERSIEAVNAAAMSYGSHRLRILTHEVLRYDPDLLILYEGHNEFVERRFYRDHLDRSDALDGVQLALARWRLYSLLWRGYRKLSLRAEEPDPSGRSAGELLGLDVVREHAVDVDDDERAVSLRRFEDNIRAILEAAGAANVAVVVCTVPSNIRGWVPNDSGFPPGCDAGARARVLAMLAEGRAALRRGDATAAEKVLAPAVALAPGHAELHYRLAQAYEMLGRWPEAHDAYVLARDRDSKPTRATTAINDALRRLAHDYRAGLVDAERVFERASPHGVPGYELLQDYVHPRPLGHRLIALELYKHVLENGYLGPPRAAREEDFRAAVGEKSGSGASDTDSPALIFNLAVVLENQGRLDDAIDNYRRARDLDPRFFVEAASNLGRLLYATGRYAEAAVEHRAALAADPDHLKSLLGLGEDLRALGRLDDAIEVLERATRADAGSAPAWNRLGVALAAHPRWREAEGAFRMASNLEPAEPDYRVDLGYALLIAGKVDDAAREFETALAAVPHDRRAWNGMAAVNAERGFLDEAERIFSESLRIDPGDAYARAGLDTVASRRP